MADGPNDFRDPKVTTTGRKDSGGGIGKWIAIAVGAILLLLLLGWLLGLFADDDVDAAVVPAEDGEVIVTD
jgi:succinate dehydrogenase hydrophobic anchor subunit